MSFNLFGPTTKEDIKVGYIDPQLGYVDGVSICEANNYAQNNPGTSFIFLDGGNNIRYLNINEVNRLTPEDLTSSKEECGGIQNYTECGPPVIQFSGGGGIGAVGNPVVGADGALLAVDLVSGGHGYQYPPQVVANDNCNQGNGALLTAVLGETVDQIEVYDGEEDFEDYQLCNNEEIGYGTKYNNDGEESGEWDPSYYTEIGTDPIQQEIKQFQEALKNPFWTTREIQPDRISVSGVQYATQETTNVTDPRWGEFMNKYAISPVKPSDTIGTDEAGKLFNIEWELNFPITGEYIFRGVCDNLAQVYIDNSLVGDLKNFDQNPSPLQKTITEGNHIIRVDLLNAPVVENVKLVTEETNNTVDVTFKITGNGRNTDKMKFSFVSDDYSFTLKGNPGGGQSRKVTVKINPNSKFKVYASSTKDGGVEQGIIKNGTKNKEGGSGDSNTIFADHIQSDNDNDDLQITADSGSFNASNRRKTPDGRSTFDLTFQASGAATGPTTTVEGSVVSPKSFNENPMGVSMLIEAPAPPVPQEQLPIPEGECPPNPIWTTRFTGSSQQWYPVNYPTWSNFLNRYAISPVLPLDTPGSDGSGIVHTNSWDIIIPYRGFYEFQVQRDNTARIYVDGNLAFDIKTSGDAQWVKEGLVGRIKAQKIFLEKGRRTISIEVENTPENTNSIIDQKIFSTQDWRVGQPTDPEGVDVTFKVSEAGSDGSSVDIIDVLTANRDGQNITKKLEPGKVYKVVAKPSDRKLRADGKILRLEDSTDNDFNDLVIRATSGKFYDVDGNKCKFVLEGSSNTSQSVTKNGVTYEGPELFGHTETRWSQYMNDFSVSPKVFSSIGEPDDRVVGKYTLSWKGVNFPESGTYKFNLQGDNIAKLKIDGVDILETTDFTGNKVQYTFNVTAGSYNVDIELENLNSAQDEERRKAENRKKDKKKKDKGGEDDFIFTKNPMGVALYISRDVILSESNKTSWTTNPVAISAILVPPPCAKQIGGKGVVAEVVIQEPGNGYPQPPSSGYPVVLILDRVEVENPGINYGETDVIQITPNNGAVLEPVLGPFGEITSVNVLNPGRGFTVYPSIEVVPSVPTPGTPGAPSTGTFGTPSGPSNTIPTSSLPAPTGVNAKFRPVFRVVRDPVQLLEDEQIRQEQLIQVTDLVGLKQTGYVDGRAYFGAVYYDDGIPYAGYYKTAGNQVRVYNTLQESITAQVTTRPSAIQRSGTDIRSNDPRLNIPGTPQSTTEQ